MTLETEIVKLEKHLERHLYRRSILQQKKEECNANIRDLGVLPEDAFDKYVGFSIEKVNIYIYMSLLLNHFYTLNIFININYFFYFY